MKKRGSAVAAGDPAREQAREAVPARLGALGALDAARSVTLQRHGSRAGGCVPVCLLKPRRESRRCLRGGAEGLAGERGTSMRHGRWVRTAKRAGGPSGPLTYTHLPRRAGKHVKTLESRDLGRTQSHMEMRAGIVMRSAENVEITRFLQHVR